MKALIKARDFRLQEAALRWLLADAQTKFYLEHRLASVLRMLSDMKLGIKKFAWFAATREMQRRGVVQSGYTYQGVYYPRDLFLRMINAELEHRLVARMQEDYAAATPKSKISNLFERVLDGLTVYDLVVGYTDPKPSSDGDIN
jgi:hypothetical protein